MPDTNWSEIKLRDYAPKSELVMEEHLPIKAKFPLIDAHCHIARAWNREGGTPETAKKLVEKMDAAGLAACVNLDVGSPRGLSIDKELEIIKDHRDRFILFHVLNWKRIEEGGGFGEKMAADLRETVKKGAQGVKIHKTLGLRIRDPKGKLLMPDDERLAPVFETAGELGIPILFHIADPIAFFKPLNETNERLEELSNHPSWHFIGDEFPSFEKLMEVQVKFAKRYPKTTFISAHVCSYSENLTAVAKMLDECPNLNADISARFSELGRQPYTARKFLVKYADRLLYGSDFGPDPDYYRITFRLFETEDEHFDPCPHWPPDQGRWKVYGLNLPDKVLKKLYRENAARLIPGVKP